MFRRNLLPSPKILLDQGLSPYEIGFLKLNPQSLISHRNRGKYQKKT
jgi:hypothetical protein